jgi:hypothetical protein
VIRLAHGQRGADHEEAPHTATSAAPAGASDDCVIEGPGGPFTRDYLVFALPDKSSPIARVVEQVPLRISLISESSIAAVTLSSPAVELGGFVARDDLRFVTRERVAIAGSQLFVERGRPLAVRAVKGSRVTAEVPTPFQRYPATIQISCENLAYEAGAAGPIRSPTVSWASQHTSGPIALFDAPRGSLVLRAETAEAMRVLEARDGFTHVSIGDVAPWCDQGVVADVWVASGDIAPRAEPPDIDDACFSVLDRNDRCPAARVERRTELWLGDTRDSTAAAAHVGWLKQGTEVTTGESRRDRLVEVTLDERAIAAPPKLAFFAAADAITGACLPNVDDDGCPCDAP